MSAPDGAPVRASNGGDGEYCAMAAPGFEYRNGAAISFRAHRENAGACFVNVRGIGRKPLRAISGMALYPRAIVAGMAVVAHYVDATDEFLITSNLWPGAGASTGAPYDDRELRAEIGGMWRDLGKHIDAMKEQVAALERANASRPQSAAAFDPSPLHAEIDGLAERVTALEARPAEVRVYELAVEADDKPPRPVPAAPTEPRAWKDILERAGEEDDHEPSFPAPQEAQNGQITAAAVASPMTRAEAVAALESAVSAALLRHTGNQASYELAVQATNQNPQAMGLLDLEASERGMSVSDLAEEIMEHRFACERHTMETRAAAAKWRRVLGGAEEADREPQLAQAIREIDGIGGDSAKVD